MLFSKKLEDKTEWERVKDIHSHYTQWALFKTTTYTVFGFLRIKKEKISPLFSDLDLEPQAFKNFKEQYNKFYSSWNRIYGP